ncbi:MAG: hypothetical protein LC745_12960 [Planctomycetia bacterium]|nr:hypothetical protein [Planctomycetia bacterium]
MVITYPLGTVIDDAGVVQTGATVTIASVKDKTGTLVASPGAVLNAGNDPFFSVDYDAEAHVEAVLTLTITKTGSTFTGVNTPLRVYLASDSSRISTSYTTEANAASYIYGTVAASPAPTTTVFTVALSSVEALNALTIAADLAGLSLTFQAGSVMPLKTNTIQSVVVNSTTSVAVTLSAPLRVPPAGGPVGTGDRVMIWA